MLALKMNIRKATTQDAPLLIEHLASLKNENLDIINPITKLPTVEEETQWIKSFTDQSGVLLVCEDDSLISGILNIQKHEDGYGYIGMSVLKEYRRKGRGKRLLQHLLELCKNDNIFTGIRLEVKNNNSAAISLYEQMGFCYVEKNDTDLELMEHRKG